MIMHYHGKATYQAPCHAYQDSSIFFICPVKHTKIFPCALLCLPRVSMFSQDLGKPTMIDCTIIEFKIRDLIAHSQDILYPIVAKRASANWFGVHSTIFTSPINFKILRRICFNEYNAGLSMVNMFPS